MWLALLLVGGPGLGIGSATDCPSAAQVRFVRRREARAAADRHAAQAPQCCSYWYASRSMTSRSRPGNGAWSSTKLVALVEMCTY
jgi:hypothetical protein